MTPEEEQRHRERIEYLRGELSMFPNDYLLDVTLTIAEIMAERAGWISGETSDLQRQLPASKSADGEPAENTPDSARD